MTYRKAIFSLITIVIITAGVLQLSAVYQAALVPPGLTPDSIVKSFIEQYSIPGFVLNSIDPTQPDVIKDGIKLAYIIAIEGIVLLKNTNNTLPIKPGEKIALFGVGQHWAWFYHEGGSAFTYASPTRVVTLLEGLRNANVTVDTELVQFYEQWVATQGRNLTSRGYVFRVADEPLWTDEQIKYYADKNDVAMIVISRWSTEGRDIPAAAGFPEGYYLTQWELNLLQLVSKYFKKVVVVLNTPGPIDMTWDSPSIGAILWASYPGEQGGNAVAAVLLGLVSPSGKLPDTWACTLSDYPSTTYFGRFDATYWEDIYVGYRYFDTFNRTIAYPFGFGLSYTTFKIDVLNTSIVDKYYIRVDARVTNTGNYSGKEVVQVYVSKPDGLVEKPYQELVAFAKTDFLQPGQSQVLSIVFDVRLLTSYSEDLSAWILDNGSYIIRVGNSSRSTRVAAVLELNQTVIVEDTINRMHAPTFTRLRKGNATPITYPGEKEEIAAAPRLYIDPADIPTVNKTYTPPTTPPRFTPANATVTITLKDVFEGKYSLQQLIAQMNVTELVNVTIGLRGLPKYGIPELRQADGPNGKRDGPSSNPSGTAFPVSVLRAATWNLELETILGYQIGREMVWANIQLWLAPGINIHRNPLCGRNAEYYSEDPVLAGVMAAAATKGVQSNHGVGVTLKHYVGNEQEFNRFYSNSIISERALREIYLKPFEIAVKTADPWSIMTSYNKVNGLYTGNDFALIEGILRYEWGFNGFVMTDWGSGSCNFRAYYAGNDAIMPYSATRLATVLNQTMDALATGLLDISHLQRSAYNILKIAIRSRAFANITGVDQSYVYRYTPPPDYFIATKSTPIYLVTETLVNTVTQTIITTNTITHAVTQTQSVTTTLTTTLTETFTQERTTVSTITSTTTDTKTLTGTITVTKTVPETVAQTDWTMTGVIGVVTLIIGLAIGYLLLRPKAK